MAVVILWVKIWMYSAFATSCSLQTDTFLFSIIYSHYVQFSANKFQPVNPWRPYSHVQDYPWSPGIPHGVHLRTSNPKRATRPRPQVPPTAMLYAPSPIHLHNSGFPILEQTADWDSQRILGGIFKDTPGYPLAAPVPRSTHLTQLLSQPIPSAHIGPRKKTHTQMTLPIYSHYPTWSLIVVFTAS